jgi:glutamyl/glutaminyl-tRNA synthetase
MATLEANIKRLFWRIGNGKFEPNDKDVKALTEVVEWINRQKVQEINQHHLFAKLYVKAFFEEIEKYKDPQFAQYTLHSHLQKPIETIYLEFENNLNSFEFELFCEKMGIKMGEHPMQTPEEQREFEMEIIKSNESEYLKLVTGKWTTEKIFKALNNQISETINKFKNK